MQVLQSWPQCREVFVHMHDLHEYCSDTLIMLQQIVRITLLRGDGQQIRSRSMPPACPSYVRSPPGIRMHERSEAC